ncbi:hypothetical protein [Leptospira noguchii]|uniref:hypothetical protein n=1 Tax=Leptospira noguchii TaxID=28182 RepID=UPI001FB752DF|nr:hypothetical protein [Leptospira noguchii]UOG49208.1 hypothetical protein MAL00_02530 [Leptospira noguchii]
MGTQFYRGFVVIPTDIILRSKYLWVRLWLTTDRVNSAPHSPWVVRQVVSILTNVSSA